MLGPHERQAAATSTQLVEAWLTDNAAVLAAEEPAGALTTLPLLNPPTPTTTTPVATRLALQPRRHSTKPSPFTSKVSISTASLAQHTQPTHQAQQTQQAQHPSLLIKKRSLSSSLLNLLRTTTAAPLLTINSTITEEEVPTQPAINHFTSNHNHDFNPTSSPTSTVSSSSLSDMPAFFHSPATDEVSPYSTVDRSGSTRHLFAFNQQEYEFIPPNLHSPTLRSRSRPLFHDNASVSTPESTSHRDILFHEGDDEETEDVLVRRITPSWVAWICGAMEDLLLPASSSLTRGSDSIPAPVFGGVPAFITVPSAFYRNGVYVTVSKPKYNPVLGAITYTVACSLLKINIPQIGNEVTLQIAVEKRFTDFRNLYGKLRRMFASEIPSWPDIPSKSYFKRFHASTVNMRLSAFSSFMTFVVLHPILYNSPPFLDFMKLR
ncbi:hypothetical protein HDU99_002737 [Rhizoclosmatium hyalinum]|nr:hypothetical protein HDU99_002737 [Rhizoclosmatium hyalinum]